MDLESLDEYRIALIGPSNCGKTTIISTFRSLLSSNIHHDRISSTNTILDSVDNSHSDAVCVVLKCGGPVGIRLKKHNQLKDFSCVESFVRSPDGSKPEIEMDGRVQVDDIVVAINKTSLARLGPPEAAEVIRREMEISTEPVVVAFIRPRTDDSYKSISRENSRVPMSPSSVRSADEDSEHTSEAVCVDRPTVSVSTMIFSPVVSDYTASEETSACLVELVEIPSSGPDVDIVMKEWVPRLDGMVLVYSADSIHSLVELEKVQARRIVQCAGAELYDLPIVVVCNKCDTTASCRSTLISEGQTLADAWGAPFFTVSCLDGGESDMSCQSIDTVFAKMVERIKSKFPQTDNTTSMLTSTWDFLVGSLGECGAQKSNPPPRKLRRIDEPEFPVAESSKVMFKALG
eukprot:CAMPEP_0185030330 /NCGR_PEP_ID=MMETSP1103-20130426/17241_1 /TAXON_ID=36769 /ORGANISM="Paraphysomonas bandaiensis, Strain Caron Lab Isolate" /LENGTH=403 /DNA_ID=CAMNT_0027565415 /DNA_START=54 /DNA_END=1266 /DNA_ORIENTATION=-